MSDPVSLSIDLDEAVGRAVRRLAVKEGVTPAAVVNALLRKALAAEIQESPPGAAAYPPPVVQPPGGRNWLEVGQVGGVTVVRFRCDKILGVDMAQALGEQLERLAQGGGPPRLLLNFAAVRFMGSPMLGKLIAFVKKVDAAGGRVAFCAFDPNLTELLQVTRLDRLLHIYADEQEALRSFPS
jgi:anti-anti-sigma factor